MGAAIGDTNKHTQETTNYDDGRACGWLTFCSSDSHSDILHPNRPNISKEELSEKLAGLYKAGKDQVSVFGLRTQFGGGKTTGFALIYDSPEAMKKFEPHYRLVRVGLAKKIEKASRQQRTYTPHLGAGAPCGPRRWPADGHNAGREQLTVVAGAEQNADSDFSHNRQAAQEPTKDPARYGEGQGCQGQEGEISDSPPSLRFRIVDTAVLLLLLARSEALLRFSSWFLVEHCEGSIVFGWQGFIYPRKHAEGQRGHTHRRCSISHDTAIFDNRDDTIHLKSLFGHSTQNLF